LSLFFNLFFRCLFKTIIWWNYIFLWFFYKLSWCLFTFNCFWVGIFYNCWFWSFYSLWLRFVFIPWSFWFFI